MTKHPKVVHDKLLIEMNKKITGLLNNFSKSCNGACDKVERKLLRVEMHVSKLVKKQIDQTDRELALADNLVSKELRSKIIMSQWTNGFLANSSEMNLDPIAFAFARFSLNICLTFAEVPVANFLQSKVHILIVSLLSFESDLVVGPAMLGLAHLALLPDMKQPIVAAGCFPIILQKLVHSKSDLILTQALKVCAALSLEPCNKVEMARSGCMHAVFDLICGLSINEHVQYAALTAIVNLLQGSDSNRLLSIELAGIKPLLQCIQSTSHHSNMLEAVKALANISYLNSYTSQCILSMAGDAILVEALENSDIGKESYLIHCILCTLSNMCTNETNQSHVGSSNGAVDVAVRVIEYGREPYVVAAASSFLVAVMWKNKGNKCRLASKGLCAALLKRIIRHTQLFVEEKYSASHDENPPKSHLYCLERLCLCMACFLLYEPNQELLQDIGGLQELVRIVKHMSDARGLMHLAPVIVSCVPSPDDLVRYHDDEHKAPMERVDSVPILKKLRLLGFGHLPTVPYWLDQAISIMSSTDAGLRKMPRWVKEEFIDKLILFNEFNTDIYPDTTIMGYKEGRHLLFSVY